MSKRFSRRKIPKVFTCRRQRLQFESFKRGRCRPELTATGTGYVGKIFQKAERTEGTAVTENRKQKKAPQCFRLVPIMQRIPESLAVLFFRETLIK
jgi:hypothetical protein